MHTENIEQFLRDCTPQQLDEVLAAVQKLRGAPAAAPSPAAYQRAERRFETNLLALLTRITDVKPNEKREYSVTIRDISRTGMKLLVDTSFVPSRLVEVNFTGPRGKSKRAILEIIRIRKMNNDKGAWLEIGCHTVQDEKTRRLLLQEQKISNLRSRLHRRIGLLVLVVGPETPWLHQVLTRLKTADWRLRYFTCIPEALREASRSGAQLALFCNGSQIAHDDDLRTELLNAPPSLARLALVLSEEDRFPLLDVGIDETLCVDPENLPGDLLFHAMERALVAHTVRRENGPGLSANALILGRNHAKTNLITYQLQDHGYRTRPAPDLARAVHFTPHELDVIFADFDDLSTREFQQLIRHFAPLPVIALCSEISTGRDAMCLGAANYLAMPIPRDELRLVLACLRPASSLAAT